MNFGKIFVLIFALARLVDAVEDDTPKLRGLATTIAKSRYYVNSFSETLGQCTGAMCGMWGDPHVLTCDGLGYDCNAHGIFTVMKNHLYNIQARFINGNSEMMAKRLGWGTFPKVSFSNDIVIQNVQNDEIPVMQFSFPEFFAENGLPLEEQGCYINFIFDRTLSGHTAQNVTDVEACRMHCEEVEGCAQFYFSTGSHLCHLADKDAILKKKPTEWSRTIAGHVNLCGHPVKYEGRGEDDDAFAKLIGNDIKYGQYDICPLLYYENGVLQNISSVGDKAYLYGDANSPTYVKLYGRNKIKIVTTTEKGSISQIMLEAGGKGPGSHNGCHWNFFVCLPQAEQSDFETLGSLGLLGSPDGIRSNDWTDITGSVLPLPEVNSKNTGKRGAEAHNYCLNNWCVSQQDSLITPPKDATYDDIKCHHEEYIPFEEQTCLYSNFAIQEHCGHLDPLPRHQCQVECCAGNCDGIEVSINEIQTIKRFSTDEEADLYDVFIPNDVCEEGQYVGTGETACPSADGSVVQVTHQTADIPDGEPIIYGITYPHTQDDNHGREISFRIGNPFGSNADAYVRYGKKVGRVTNDPACEKSLELVPGCESEATEIVAGCIEYPNKAAFALVDVYFATDSISGDAEIEKCCHPEDYTGVGVVKYSFKIQCECPDSEITIL